MPEMTKAQALDIFAQMAAQFRATPQEHQLVQQALAKLNSLVEPMVAPKENVSGGTAA